MSEENRIEVINEVTYIEIVEDKTTVEIIEEIVDIVEVAIQGPPGPGLPLGGTTGQVLGKKSNASCDSEWLENPVITIQKIYDTDNDGIVDNAEHALMSDDSNLFSGRPVTDFYDTTEVNALTARYTYIQSSPATNWVITHNLGRFPSGVTVVDSAGSIVEGAIRYINNNALEIIFNYAFSGTVYIG